MCCQLEFLFLEYNMPDLKSKIANRKSLRVGITGGIGSGKTTVCRIFESLGVPVYYADDRAKWLIGHDADLKAGIVALLGESAYLPDGNYNRAWVGGIVFQDKAKLAALNALVHPAVERDSQQWHAEQIAKGAPYTLKEAALLVESGGYRFMDALIVVTAPEALRIARVVARDGTSAEAVQARMANQLPESAKLELADYVVKNDGEHLLIPQVQAIHRQLNVNINVGRV